jgi:hypothetical protein
MKILTEADVIRVMRTEWGKKVKALAEAVDVVLTTKVGQDKEKTVVSPELKVRHTKSGIRYTVDSVGPKNCILRTPEGEKFLVDAAELENDYHLD